MVLTPALLFRTMSTVHVEQLDFKPVMIYFVAALVLFVGQLIRFGLNRRSALMALTATFGNTVMIGVPLIGLAYGQPGLVTLFTLISVHSLILLTATTVVLETLAAHEERLQGRGQRYQILLAVLAAAKSGVLHPIPFPIILGLLFAQTGLVMPAVLDKPLQLLGSAFAPIALLLVGVTLAHVQVGMHLKPALGLSFLKNLALPALVAALGWALGASGVPFTAMIVTASLPVGANVFLFAERYAVAEELVAASMAVSTVLGLVTISLVMWLVALMGV
jgi:predicted permease